MDFFKDFLKIYFIGYSELSKWNSSSSYKYYKRTFKATKREFFKIFLMEFPSYQSGIFKNIWIGHSYIFSRNKKVTKRWFFKYLKWHSQPRSMDFQGPTDPIFKNIFLWSNWTTKHCFLFLIFQGPKIITFGITKYESYQHSQHSHFEGHRSTKWGVWKNILSRTFKATVRRFLKNIFFKHQKGHF